MVLVERLEKVVRVLAHISLGEKLCVDISEGVLVDQTCWTNLLEALVHELELLARELGAPAEVFDALRLAANRSHLDFFHGIVGEADVSPGFAHHPGDAMVGPQHGRGQAHGQV